MNEIELSQLERLHRELGRVIASSKRDAAKLCPIQSFVIQKLTNSYGPKDISGEELWALYQEYVLECCTRLMRKVKFQRRIAEVIYHQYGVKRSTNVRRDGRRVRGFLGVSKQEPLPQPDLD
jgi:hypothetical protein